MTLSMVLGAVAAKAFEVLQISYTEEYRLTHVSNI